MTMDIKYRSKYKMQTGLKDTKIYQDALIVNQNCLIKKIIDIYILTFFRTHKSFADFLTETAALSHLL